MIVEIGNADAIEAVRMVRPDGSEELAWQAAPGERVTTFHLPDGLTAMEAFSVVIAGLDHQMSPNSRPWWIECEDEAVRRMLVEHFGLDMSASRPQRWGDGSTTAKKED